MSLESLIRDWKSFANAGEASPAGRQHALMEKIIEQLTKRPDAVSTYANAELDEAGARALAVGLLTAAAQIAFQNHDRRLAVFSAAENVGAHFLPVHFYSPLPAKREIDDAVFERRYDDIPGLEVDRTSYHELLKQIAHYASELYDVPREYAGDEPIFSWLNASLWPGDAIVYYCLIRHLKPQRIVEIGSGQSSIIAAKALARNGHGFMTCVEPYPSQRVRRLADEEPHVQLIPEKLQRVKSDVFTQLNANDILFIDSSHVAKIDSDVNHEIFRILPHVARGVWCHVHDIFLPLDYPRSWVLDKQLFWNEQYVLMAFLAFNTDFRIRLANNYVACEMRDEWTSTFPSIGREWPGGGSLWFERVKSVQGESQQDRAVADQR
jgi:hypothetical protein